MRRIPVLLALLFLLPRSEFVKKVVEIRFRPSTRLVRLGPSTFEGVSRALVEGQTYQVARNARSVELVWTGPESDGTPFRRTEQAILQVLDAAQRRITLVSYAVYQIPFVREALARAAKRGVEITVIVETPNKLEGQNEYDTLKALGREVSACAQVYYWPEEERGRDQGNNKLGILHVKCVAADGQWLLLSSANLTEYAFTINMELGVLIEGGDLPASVEQHFEKLIKRGVLKSVSH